MKVPVRSFGSFTLGANSADESPTKKPCLTVSWTTSPRGEHGQHVARDQTVACAAIDHDHLVLADDR